MDIASRIRDPTRCITVPLVHRTGAPRGVLYPTTRDELVESVALLAAVERGRLDALLPPEHPLDILAQQIVAEAAARGEEGVAEDELFEQSTRAWPYRELSRAEFDEVVRRFMEHTEMRFRLSYILGHVTPPKLGVEVLEDDESEEVEHEEADVSSEDQQKYAQRLREFCFAAAIQAIADYHDRALLRRERAQSVFDHGQDCIEKVRIALLVKGLQLGLDLLWIVSPI